MTDCDSMWSAIVDNLKEQIAACGEGICHSRIMQQVLQERIVGEATEEKYAAALVALADATKTKWTVRPTADGLIFVFFSES
jgi:hypothetical protein